MWIDRIYQLMFFHSFQHIFCLVIFPQVVQNTLDEVVFIASYFIARFVMNICGKNY